MNALHARLRRLEKQAAPPLTIAERLHAAEHRLAGMTQAQRDAQHRAECIAALSAPTIEGHGIAARLQRADRRMARHYLAEVN